VRVVVVSVRLSRVLKFIESIECNSGSAVETPVVFKIISKSAEVMRIYQNLCSCERM